MLEVVFHVFTDLKNQEKIDQRRIQIKMHEQKKREVNHLLTISV